MPHHMGHHEHHEHHEHGPPHPPHPSGGLEHHMGECPCSQCMKPMSKEEEISTLEDYKREIHERLGHVERRLDELHKA
jgi:hypothetical protein